MVYVALAEAAALALVALGFLSYLRSSDRAHARREDLLVNQLCAIAGKPWQQPPAERDQPVLAEVGYATIAAPEQLPDY